MLDWLRKLMAGDQNSVPPGATVERDELGRVTKIGQTLSLAGASQDASAHPALAPADGLAPRLAAACEWLRQQNVQLARRHGLGLEQNYAFDQDTGRLILTFEGDRKLVASAQILGSFDPRDRSFMWGWANPSIQPENSADATRLKVEGERLGLAALTTPTQIVNFDTLTPLLAFGAQHAGADGLYRCMVNGSTSVFVTFRLDAATGQVPADDAMLAAAHLLATSYDAEMLPLDQQYRARKDESGVMLELLERKMEVYRRYWSRSDDYWEPSSFGWPSDHDPATLALRFTIPHPDGGALDVAIGEHAGQTVYRIEPVEGALRITDMLLNWGDGFIWPRVQ